MFLKQQSLDFDATERCKDNQGLWVNLFTALEDVSKATKTGLPLIEAAKKSSNQRYPTIDFVWSETISHQQSMVMKFLKSLNNIFFRWKIRPEGVLKEICRVYKPLQSTLDMVLNGKV